MVASRHRMLAGGRSTLDTFASGRQLQHRLYPMFKRPLLSLLAKGVLLLVVSLGSERTFAQTIFSDNFESDSMANWTTTGTSPLVTSNLQNIEPIGGSISAYMNTSADRMHHNLIADKIGRAHV